MDFIIAMNCGQETIYAKEYARTEAQLALVYVKGKVVTVDLVQW